jgi:hypothetical protein
MKRLRKSIAAMTGLTLALGYMWMKGERMWDAKSVTLGVMWGTIIAFFIFRDPERSTAKPHLVVSSIFVAIMNGIAMLTLPTEESIKVLIFSTALVACTFLHAWAYGKEQDSSQDKAEPAGSPSTAGRSEG